MGFTCDLQEVFTFRYCETLENGLIENEFDHVFFGLSNLPPIPNPLEVMAFKYMTMDELELDLQTNPDDYTIWFKICFAQVLDKAQKTKEATI
jgi:isopentenyl-diphosphate delta-isomerase